MSEFNIQYKSPHVEPACGQDGSVGFDFKEIYERFNEGDTPDVKQEKIDFGVAVLSEFLMFCLPERCKPGCEVGIGRRLLSVAFVVRPDLIRGSPNNEWALKRAGLDEIEIRRVERRNKGLAAKEVSPDQRAIEDALVAASANESHTIEAPSLRSMATDLEITAPNFSTAEFSKRFNYVGRAQAQGWTEKARADLNEQALQPAEALDGDSTLSLPTTTGSEQASGEENGNVFSNN